MNAKVDPSEWELRALEQRKRLHESVVALKRHVREKLDVKRTARKYFVPAGGVISLLSLLLGYSLTGIFTRH